MLLKFKDCTIRDATADDAKQLAKWWNDGTIMAHAGFPNGTGETAEDIANSLKNDTDDTYRRLMIEFASIPIGEMNDRNKGEDTAEIGIKICDISFQDQGLGQVLLRMLLACLFHDMGYRKVILDTNVENKRAQHVYEKLGFKKLRVREHSWQNQLGEWQSSIDYELDRQDFVNDVGGERPLSRPQNH